MIAVALQFLRGLPWREILPILAVVTFIGIVAWNINSHLNYVGDIEDTVKAQEADLLEQRVTIRNMRAEQQKANDAIAVAERARVRLELLYNQAVSEPPEQIVRWRDRIVTIPAEITGPTCEEALIQAHQIITDTAGWPGDSP